MEKVKKIGSDISGSTFDKYSVDKLARDCHFFLARDFALVDVEIKKYPCYARGPWKQDMRDTNYKLAYWGHRSGVASFKRHYQLANFLKKYTFTNDMYSSSERETLTTDKFLRFQELLATPRGDYKHTTQAVIREARKFIHDTLGEYNEDEVSTYRKFGQKSGIGCSLANAFVDFKLCERVAYSSTCLSHRAFDKAINTDPLLLEHLCNAGLSDGIESFPNVVESLTYRQVPKTFKINRGITPLSLLALYMSYGVGGVVQERLKNVGVDITRQQTRHREWIRKFSRTRSHATADLTSASDSITLGLLHRLLPRPWYNAVKTFLSHTMEIRGCKGLVKVCSVLPMGNGATFPLETLIFYALLKAVGKLTGITGLISVYGDDLIYPTPLHKYVVGVFSDLGFQMNLEKTYTDAHFRESCGSDYYHGVDVRPAFFPESASMLTRTQYASLIYKTLNSLLARWDHTEISRTVAYLLNELRFVGLEIFRVPPSLSSYAGIQTENPVRCAVELPSDGYALIDAKLIDGSIQHRFKLLAPSSQSRRVTAVLPYYWVVLQRNATSCRNALARHTPMSHKAALDKLVELGSSSELSWRVKRRTRWFSKGSKRVAKTQCTSTAYVKERDISLKVGAASIYDWR